MLQIKRNMDTNWRFFFLVALTLLVAVSQCDASTISEQDDASNHETSYHGYTVYRSVPATSEQLAVLKSLMQVQLPGVEFWQEPIAVNRSVDILASPKASETLLDFLRAKHVAADTFINDVGRKIEESGHGSGSGGLIRSNSRQLEGRPALNMSAALDPIYYYKRYQRFSTFEEKLAVIKKEFPTRANVSVIGISYERRPLYLVKVSSNGTSSLPLPKPIVLIDGLHHAREWVSHSTAMYLLDAFLGKPMPVVAPREQTNDNSMRSRKRKRRSRRSRAQRQRSAASARSSPDTDTKDLDNNNEVAQFSSVSEGHSKSASRDVNTKSIQSAAAAILEKYDIWFVPMINPDGYEYTHTSNRLWRKTMSKNKIACRGTDPNRNYPYEWAVAGASNYSCDQTYAGPAPLSEPETRALANLIDKNKSRIKMYLTLHAYSQVIISPWGYTREYPATFNELRRVAKAGIAAIQAHTSGTRYDFGTAANLLYPAAGGSDDYAYGSGRIPYAYTIELPDTGSHGFLLPPEEIVRVGEETFAGVAAMINALR